MELTKEELSYVNFEKIKRDCFWDYSIDEAEILRIVNSGNEREVQHLFSKIAIHSTNRICNIKILFKNHNLLTLFNSLKMTRYNAFAERNILIARRFLLGENHIIKGLEWVKW